MRILLTEKDLIELLKGKVVKNESVEIALQDIGYDRIVNALIEHLE